MWRSVSLVMSGGNSVGDYDLIGLYPSFGVRGAGSPSPATSNLSEVATTRTGKTVCRVTQALV